MGNKRYAFKKQIMLVMLICIISTAHVLGQNVNDYQSSGTGVHVDLSSANNWQYWDGTAWQAATAAPFTAGTHQVGTNGKVTILSADTWDNASALSLASKSATIVFNGLAGSFSTTNKLTLNTNIYQHNTSANESVIAAGIVFSTTSTTIYSYSSGTVPAASFGSLTIASGSTYSLGGAASTVASGTLKVDGTFNCGANTFTVKTSASASSTLTGSGTITTGAIGTRLTLGSVSGLAINVNFTGTLCGVTLNAPVVLQSDLTISASGFTPQFYFNQSGIYTDLNGHSLSCGSINGAVANVLFKNTSPGSIVTSGSATIATDGSALNNITLGASASLNSNVSVNGIFTQSAGTFTTNSFGLSLGSSASAVIGSTAALTISSGGTVDFNNRPVTIQSTASGTGHINTISGTLSNATNVTIQQYLSAKRGWRFLGNPTGASLTLSTFATNSNIDLNNGTQSAATAYTYDGTKIAPASPWVAAGATWAANKGLLLFVRGKSAEGVGGGSYTPSNVTLSATGSLVSGTQAAQSLTYDAVNTNAQWNVVVNPYPSPVSVKNLTGIYNNAGINQSIYVFNPNKNTGATNASLADGDYDFVTLGSSTDFIIPSFGAFFIQTQAASQTVQFTEAAKASGGDQRLFGTNTDYRVAELLLTDKDNNALDRAELMQDAGSTSLGNDHWDLPKLTMSKQYLCLFSSDNKQLAIDARKSFLTDTVKMGAFINNQQEYKLQIGNYSLPDDIVLELKDNYAHTTTELKKGTSYSFTVTADAASEGMGRFLIYARSSVTAVVSDGQNNTGDALLNVMPNPARDHILLQLPAYPAPVSTTIKMFSIDGKLVKEITTSQNGGTLKIAIAELPKGLYVVHVLNAGKRSIAKIIKN
ncbi:MAG: T9SS type A sorting domain-containing protein [Sphingobacteriia bacterium]|nr:T9SS type A sorting domain-containing protein [Sphingobacteriia bacterium]